MKVRERARRGNLTTFNIIHVSYELDLTTVWFSFGIGICSGWVLNLIWWSLFQMPVDDFGIEVRTRGLPVGYR